jgi:glycine/D-amino acid oxidase-like deaminating enzyme
VLIEQTTAFSDKNSLKEHPLLVVGAGVAGCLCAWYLRAAGVSVVMVDDSRPGRASTVGAGILDPISPRSSQALPMARELFGEALDVFQSISQLLRRPVFHSLPILREDFDGRNCEENGLWSTELLSLPDGCRGLRINGGGWVDFPSLLTLPKALEIEFVTATIADGREFHQEDDGAWRWQGRKFGGVIFCCGYAPEHPLGFDPGWRVAAGDILTVKIPGWDQGQIRQKTWFTVPLGGDLYRAGGNFLWNFDEPDKPEKRAETICRELEVWTGCPVEWLEHRTGLRPYVKYRRPLAGPLPGFGNAWVLNGLGSRAALRGPAAARHLVDVITGRESPDPQLAPVSSSPTARLTTTAQNLVAPFLGEGSIAIDGTAGNGKDTLFLARAVGSSGRVAAFDVQKRAMERTQSLLSSMKVDDRVTLLQASHDHCTSLLPPEWKGKISTVMMNLGYLPGGEPEITTRATSTMCFLTSIETWLLPRAAISVLCYRGQAGGIEEHRAVADWMWDRRTKGWTLRILSSAAPTGPELFLLSRNP